MHSKGINLIIRPVTTAAGVTYTGSNGRFFLVPWRGKTLIGTTDEIYSGSLEEVRPLESEVARLLSLVKRALPAVSLTCSDVLFAYAGLRPLVLPQQSDVSTYTASRRSVVISHSEGGHQTGLLTAVGGKWTTARALAADAVDRVARQVGRALSSSDTHRVPLPSGAIGRIADYSARQRSAWRNAEAAILEELVTLYGSSLPALMTFASRCPVMLEVPAASRQASAWRGRNAWRP